MRSKQSYMDRALRHKDPRYARILDKMGYGTRHMVAQPALTPDPVPDGADETAQLRARYQDVVGKRAYHGWGAAELQRRIDEALGS